MAPILRPATPAPLVYFLPAGIQIPEYCREAGFRPATKSPVAFHTGEIGTLTSPLSDAASLEVADGMHWFPIAGKLLLGVFQSPENPVRPDQLARAEQRPGHLVRLGDGQEWLIPVARLASGGPGLPRRRAIRADGSIGWEVDAAYRELSDFANIAWDARNGAACDVTEDDLDRFAALALGVNYRIGLTEAVALGLFTDISLRGIVDALLDWPEVLRIIEQAEKKA